MHIDDSSAMEILEEIKALMDSRMTDKMSMTEDMPDAKGIEMQKIKLLGGDEVDGLPDALQDKDSEETKEEDLLRKIRKELM